MSSVIALIPAHNEEEGIVKTVEGIRAQTVLVDRVIVIADRCTDNTIPLALAAGAEVITTIDNSAKKAGALNQGIALVIDECDYILAQDADGVLCTDFIENALKVFDSEPNLGGLSGSIKAREATNLIERAQAIEYARGSRLAARDSGKVHVLSGAAALYPAHTLRKIAESRGTEIPGARGHCFMEDSLTEDFELTLAIRKLGFRCISTKQCEVTTDVMKNLDMLMVQRLRWYRGALESMWLYGWSRKTDKAWIGVGFTFFSSLLSPLVLVALVVAYVALEAEPEFWYMLVFPVWFIEPVVAARRVGSKAQLLALSFFPLWLFDNLMFFIYWQALFQALRNKTKVWVT